MHTRLYPVSSGQDAAFQQNLYFFLFFTNLFCLTIDDFFFSFERGKPLFQYVLGPFSPYSLWFEQ